MTECVVDSSVLLAIIRGEPGAEEAQRALPGSLLSVVNLSEVIAKLIDWGTNPPDIQTALDIFPCTIIGFDKGQAFSAGLLRQLTRSIGLSLGDRACLSLALSTDLPVLTTDRAWAELELGVDVRLIR